MTSFGGELFEPGTRESALKWFLNQKPELTRNDIQQITSDFSEKNTPLSLVRYGFSAPSLDPESESAFQFLLPSESATTRAKWYQGLKSITPAVAKKVFTEKSQIATPSVRYLPSLGLVDFAGKSKRPPSNLLERFLVDCKKTEVQTEFDNPVEEKEEATVPGFEKLTHPYNLWSIQLDKPCEEERCNFEIPSLRGLSAAHGLRITIWNKPGDARSLTKRNTLTHEMCLYLFGTVHSPEISTNIGDVLDTVFDAMKTKCTKSVLNVFSEEPFQDVKKGGLISLAEDIGLDPVLKQVTKTILKNIVGLESFSSSSNASLKNRLFFHAVDVRKRGDLKLVDIENKVKSQTDFNQLRQYWLTVYEKLMKRIDFYNTELVKKQIVRSERDKYFLGELQKIYVEFLCSRDLPLTIAEEVENLKILKWNPTQSYFWIKLQQFQEALMKLERFTYLTMDMYATFRLFRTFPKAPTGLTNVFYFAGRWHIQNLLFILKAMQHKGLISVCDIPLLPQEKPILSLINA